MTIRPTPRRGVYEIPFWEAVSRRELRLQRCRQCAHMWYPPGPGCPDCLSDAYEWDVVSGAGKVLSWTVFHRQYFETLTPPYVVVAAELDEGPILIANLIGTADQLRVGATVSLAYEDATTTDGESFVLYQWRLVPSGVGELGEQIRR